eukprot:c40699_g1_i1.p1 GENE.c40699_g1_i1~~c40699_g1_i1.p1  ORF type:complete len:334 (-),score=64.47 c40699_g1_i1:36-980(-)
MADTVDLAALTEYFDEPDVLAEKVEQLVEMIGDARRFIVFTGAGISTAAKIPDFRGPDGVWTRKAQGRSGPKGIRMEQAIPTYSHMALVTLQDADKLEMVVSQNVDGLHRRAGIRGDRIAELHGNCYLEVCWNRDCEKAGRQYLRTFDVSERCGGDGCKLCLKRVQHFCHCTSRRCACGAVLKDSIIHFGENLPERDLTAAFAAAETADLCLVLGSSLRVTPAAQVPETTKQRGGRLVIVNLQRTPYDDDADLVIRARIDDVMRAVMEGLGMPPVPAFELSQGKIDEAERMGVAPPADAVAAVAAAAAARRVKK